MKQTDWASFKTEIKINENKCNIVYLMMRSSPFALYYLSLIQAQYSVEVQDSSPAQDTVWKIDFCAEFIFHFPPIK